MLEIKVGTENWQTYAQVSPDRVHELVRSIGGADDRFLVVQRIPDIPEVFLQVWHEHGGSYEVEFRDGGPDRHFGTEVTHPERVTAAIVGWARRETDWGAGLRWEPLETGSPAEVPELPEDVRAQVEEHVGELLRAGYATRDELTEAAEEWLAAGDDRPVSQAQACRLVDRLWTERLAEMRSWPEVTDPDRLTRAFAALDAEGITARENFACCRHCGLTEIGAEREGARGFVFFHRQSAERAASGGGLVLHYGGFTGGAARTREIGHEVVAALNGAGLATAWDGSPETGIEVVEPDWRKRLTG